MADPLKHFTTDTGPKTLLSDLKTMLSIFKTRRTKIFVYGFMFTFVACTIFLAFSPTGNSSSPWFSNIFTTTSEPNSSVRSHFPSFFSYFFPNSSSLHSRSFAIGEGLGGNQTLGFPQLNQTINGVSPKSSKEDVLAKDGETGQRNEGLESKPSEEKRVEKSNSGVLQSKPLEKNEEKKIDKKVEKSNSTNGVLQSKESEKNEEKNIDKKVEKSNSTIGVLESKPSEKKKEEKSNSTSEVTKTKPVEKEAENLFDSMIKCNIFDGNWVRDDSYPLYPPGSCPHIDEPFNCHLNSRPDKDYQRFRWQPKSCNIPRLDGKKMLELLRGKRLVFVGDSLNRNMWESLVCILRNSVEDKSKVFEASGRREFRTEGSYSFVYKDYNCSVEFFRSPFLVQEWELPESDGTTKETLRLDLVERSSSKYKNADVIVFNTGHWWTHEKTSKGKDYYQEGSHIYGELSVADAFRKALTTWARWIDANVNRNKTTVFFRGYSASHFRGGRWNSGGQCDSETQPIKNETYLAKYPPKMKALETVIKGMKTPVYYLNITRMTDYRKDAHPSVYRKQNLSDEERKSPLRFQDCSHWCLPGVPDTWNELLYVQLLIKRYEKNHHQQQQPKRQ